MELEFFKMHGSGNDYILIDNRYSKIEEEELAKLAKKFCTRRFSVGSDGLLLLYESSIGDVKMRIFNADGSEAEMCGNGIRCFAKFCYESGIVAKTEMKIETSSGLKTVCLTPKRKKVSEVKVEMGTPDFARKHIPMTGNGRCIDEELKVEDSIFRITCLSVGNPHCVIFVDDVSSFPVNNIGPKIEMHTMFPKRTNVEFVQILSENELKARIWERGVGETLACGTGACAAVVAANELGKAGSECVVHVSGGDLKVKYLRGNITMTGPAEMVFKGLIEIPDQ